MKKLLETTSWSLLWLYFVSKLKGSEMVCQFSVICSTRWYPAMEPAVMPGSFCVFTTNNIEFTKLVQKQVGKMDTTLLIKKHL